MTIALAPSDLQRFDARCVRRTTFYASYIVPLPQYSTDPVVILEARMRHRSTSRERYWVGRIRLVSHAREFSLATQPCTRREEALADVERLLTTLVLQHADVLLQAFAR